MTTKTIDIFNLLKILGYKILKELKNDMQPELILTIDDDKYSISNIEYVENS